MTATVPLDRQRWAWRALALVPAFVFATFIANASVPATIRLEAIVVLVVAMVRPAIGLMLVALLAPLGDAIVPILGAPPVRHAETLVIAFLAGWLSVAAGDDELRPRLPAQLAAAMWMFAGVLIASVAATSLQLHRESPTELRYALVALTRAYLLSDDLLGVHAAGALLEGMGLIAATVAIARRDTLHGFLLLLTMVAGCVFAGVASGLLARGIAPAVTLARQMGVGVPRYSATVHDVNALASYYLLFLGVAFGLAVPAGRARIWWLLVCAVMLGGLMLAHSRSAAASGALVVSAIGSLEMVRGRSRKSKYVAAVMISAVLVAALLVVNTPGASSSIVMRGGFTSASLHLITARPLLGVGAGRYYSLSRLVLPPSLAWSYGLENAHDYYLQIAAELGVVGFAAFIWLLAAALSAPITRVWRGRADSVTMGCVGGTSAYLLTALIGHPFLVPETAIPFWIVLGFLVTQQPVKTVRSRWPRAAIGFACVLLLMSPLRGGVPQVRLQPGEDGFGPLETDTQGRPSRAAGAFASLFVGPTVTGVEIPMRVEGDGRAPGAIVGVRVPGGFETEVRVGGDWSTLTVPLPQAEVLVPRQRINLAVTFVAGGTAAPEHVRLDVGQIRLVTTR